MGVTSVKQDRGSFKSLIKWQIGEGNGARGQKGVKKGRSTGTKKTRKGQRIQVEFDKKGSFSQMVLR